jgi:hypothetical protein
MISKSYSLQFFDVGPFEVPVRRTVFSMLGVVVKVHSLEVESFDVGSCATLGPVEVQSFDVGPVNR